MNIDGSLKLLNTLNNINQLELIDNSSEIANLEKRKLELKLTLLTMLLIIYYQELLP